MQSIIKNDQKSFRFRIPSRKYFIIFILCLLWIKIIFTRIRKVSVHLTLFSKIYEMPTEPVWCDPIENTKKVTFLTNDMVFSKTAWRVNSAARVKFRHGCLNFVFLITFEQQDSLSSNTSQVKEKSVLKILMFLHALHYITTRKYWSTCK